MRSTGDLTGETAGGRSSSGPPALLADGQKRDGDVVKSLLAKLAFRKALGLYLGEHELTLTEVAATPLGPVEIASSSEPYSPEDLAVAIERLLAPLATRKRPLPVAVGLSSSRLFFSTRLASAGGTGTPEAVLQRALSASNLCVDDLMVDLLPGEVNKSAVASVAACRKRYITSIVSTLDRLGVRPFRTEPSPCALVRLAAKQHRPPRRSKTVLRVFLGAAQGLAVVVANGMPLAWRTFILPARAEGFAIVSAARTLKSQREHYGIESTLDYAMIHGRADLRERLQQEQFSTDMGTRVLWHEGPALDGPSTAMGLALGCLTQNVQAFDLSRSLKARASIREIFPWWDLVFATVLIAVMGLVLGAHAMKLDESYAVVQAQSTRYKHVAAADLGRLEKEKNELQQKVEAVRKFLESRISWTVYTHDISVRLPEKAELNVFQGLNQFEGIGKKMVTSGPRKSLMLQAAAPYVQSSTTPREIDMFLGALRNDAVLKRDFGSIKLTGIARGKSRNGNSPTAAFTIVCVPKGEGAAGSSPGGAGGAEKKKESK
jgi:hypothetical protein